MKHFWKRCAVLLISILFLSSCGGSKSSSTTPLTPDGTAAVPIQLTPNTINPPSSVYINGHVGNTTTGSKSYYTVAVTPGITYTITMYGLSADADLWVYNDLPFNFLSGPVCKSVHGGTTNEQCVVTANSTTMRIEVDGEFALSGATYSISVNWINPAASPILCPAPTTGTTCFSFDAFSTTGTGDTTWYATTGFVSSTTVSTDTSLGDVSPGPVPLWDIDCGHNYTSSSCNIHSNLSITGKTSNGATSCVSYTYTTYTTTSPYSYISFNYMTDSYANYDLLSFYIDNVPQLPVWSGNYPGNWYNVMYNTTAGTHTYKWCHSNSNTDGTISNGFIPQPTSGDVWVDDIYIQ